MNLKTFVPFTGLLAFVAIVGKANLLSVDTSQGASMTPTSPTDNPATTGWTPTSLAYGPGTTGSA